MTIQHTFHNHATIQWEHIGPHSPNFKIFSLEQNPSGPQSIQATVIASILKTSLA
jgi:hypothetical protein